MLCVSLALSPFPFFVCLDLFRLGQPNRSLKYLQLLCLDQHPSAMVLRHPFSLLVTYDHHFGLVK